MKTNASYMKTYVMTKTIVRQRFISLGYYKLFKINNLNLHLNKENNSKLNLMQAAGRK